MPKVKDERDGGMRYTWRGRVFPSVTTIIGGGTPKPLLVPWAAKMCAEWVVENLDEVQRLASNDPVDAITVIKNSPWKSTNRAAIRGTRLHAAAERYSNDPTPETMADILSSLAPNEQGYIKAFLRFVQEYEPTPILTEVKVYSPTFDYAGTLDAIVEIDGKNVLLDYKTGKGVYPEVALQLAAYRYADFYLDDDGHKMELPQIDECAVVHLRPRSYAYVPVQSDADTFNYFRAVRKVYDFTNEGERLVGNRRR